MSKVIIYRKEDGGVAMCIPTGELPLETVLAKDVPPNSGARIIERSDISTVQHALFNALEMPDTEIVINMDKAVEITKTRLRFEREPLLVALDVQFQRALENGEDTTAIVTEKQRLRDITTVPTVDMTAEQLISISC